MQQLQSFLRNEWVSGTGSATELVHAVTGAPVYELRSGGHDYKAALEYGRSVGGPALRAMTFHERARMLKAIAQALMARKQEFYAISSATGATKVDSWIDIEGGIGTFFVYASKGRRELPDQPFHVEGPVEGLSKNGTFVGRHICVPREGIAVHINAFNFPCWGMLEKLAPTFLAGMPALVKPASLTSYLTAAMVKAIQETGILPPGALQMVAGSTGDLFEHLTCQDVVTFTGSASTANKLRSHPTIISESIRFNAEADSLNFCLLGPDASPGTTEFDLFIKEVTREMTVKAGQKCTAVRRTFVPRRFLDAAIQALSKRLGGITVGDPALDTVRMGPLAGHDQVREVRANLQKLLQVSELCFGNPEGGEIIGADPKKGAFVTPILLHCKEPLNRSEPHDIEAFGPISTVMGYDSIDEAIALIRKGKGSLVGSVVTGDDTVARTITLGAAAYHGRVLLLNAACAGESTGHGSPMPHLVHGGPGRAGGGEEMGGIRAVLHYMQRTAIQGSPTTLTAITGEWSKGSREITTPIHPFKKSFDALVVGETLWTHRRTVTESDVVNFAGISGDFFYAHMDDIAAKDSLFARRVAHGYFVLSAAAGLFVDPAPGPVLANYGLESLRFIKPVFPGDTIQARLTVKSKTEKETPKDGVPQGVVAWDVEVVNQLKEPVAVYSILTLVRK